MSMRISRRSALVGGAAATLVIAGAGVGGYWAWGRLTGSADTDAADYAKFLADVRGDYINGRVVEHNGWVLSEHEAATIDQRAHEHAQDAPPATTSLG